MEIFHEDLIFMGEKGAGFLVRDEGHVRWQGSGGFVGGVDGGLGSCEEEVPHFEDLGDHWV